MKVSVASKLALALLFTALASMSVALGAGVVVIRSSAAEASLAAQGVARTSIRDAVVRGGTSLSQAFARSAANAVVDRDFVALRDLCRELRLGKEVTGAIVAAEDGTLLADGTDAPALRVTRSAHPSPAKPLEVRESGTSLHFVRRIEAGEQTLGFVVLTSSLQTSVTASALLQRSMDRERREGEQRLLYTALWVALFIALAAGSASLLLGRRLTRPLLSLRDASLQVAAGDLDVRVEVPGGDEIGELGDAFNRMTADLSAARAALADKARLQRELEIAADIQRALLPPAPRHPELEFSGRMLPADEVGGDFYDVLTDDADNLWITIGDVSSHGLGAGIVMLMAQSAFGAVFRAAPQLAADRAFHHVNELLRDNISHRLKDNKYVTGLLLTHQGRGKFECAGGHEWPIIIRAATGRAELVSVEGPWLGIAELSEIPIAELSLEPGDVLCLYSDGITETRDEAGDLFDEHRLIEALEQAVQQHSNLGAIADDVLTRVESFARERDDDWTLLLVRRSENDGESS